MKRWYVIKNVTHYDLSSVLNLLICCRIQTRLVILEKQNAVLEQMMKDGKYLVMEDESDDRVAV